MTTGPSAAPASTYRLQVNARFTLHDAAATLAYLHDLGVDWVYLSPLLKAEPGSDHGYDVVDHAEVDPDRGGAAGLAAVSAEARRLGMGVLVDIVPNHMGIATPRENAWWWDLLLHGPSSAHADAFDVDWEAGAGRVRIPVVGDGDAAAIEVDRSAGVVRYHEHELPLAPGTTTLAEQHYELVSWRLADTALNYRRFFAVNTLAAVRVEDRRVLEESHAEIRRWFDAGLVDGLRVDHPDGLRDPAAYLDDLGELTGGAYVLVEKILEPGETLPASWATAGTTGYDVLGLVDRVLTDPAGCAPLTALETRLRGGPLDWHDLVHDTKRAVADGILGSEIRRVVRELRGTDGLDPPLDEEGALVDAVAELAACFPVYRSYLPQGREHLDHALAEARRRRPDLVRPLQAGWQLLVEPDLAVAERFEQTTGAVMAKGVEDCAFYRTSRLTSLTEVGGDPSEWSIEPAPFHEAMALRQRTWPRAMTTTSTHDTKRGEDVRARIAVLAELPAVWSAALDTLLALAPLPDPSFGNLLWQAVVGAWPASRERLHAYAEKAMREAGDRTTWTAPDKGYERAVHAAVDAAFDVPAVSAVLDEVVSQVAAPGWSNALAAKLIALTVPGVPDVYQGSELWEQSLVDPDNRRPVDFDVRRGVLARVAAGERPPLTPHAGDPGHAKLVLTQVALTLSRNQPHRFATYAGVEARGEAAGHVVAFDRGGALTVATRLPVGLAARGWGETVLPLPDGVWADLLTGREHAGDARLSELLADYPVALLIREETP
ncbi:MAG TPA: malto-oligosyltrehalose synthase [Nocardioides sp.]|uniref:malto-oligosyltrehalose synthase n=1 Tax=Nocardioides sp. TaxID=35761 RepID=UPI002E37645E|nr:malto-oligosyltrehalose synthase [Nocardioides sp.]HEX3929675.1 malto-oligosyltrehalose synthase [Nocardioides sp.]